MNDLQRHLGLIARVTFFAFALLFPARLMAVPARDVAETVYQPDGTAISVRQFGDEWANGHRTLDGYTIMHDASTGFWKYAEETAMAGYAILL